MQSILNEFKAQSELILKQSGELKHRFAWKRLSSAAFNLSSAAEAVISNLDDKDGLLFVIAANPPGERRNQNLHILFDRVLMSVPSEGFVSILSFLSTPELINNLLPYVYEAGNRSSATVYLAARLQIELQTSAFQSFLSIHNWTHADLINLSLLVVPSEKQIMLDKLSAAAAAYETKPGEHSVFSDFMYVLTSGKSRNPVPPALEPAPAPTVLPLPNLKENNTEAEDSIPTQDDSVISDDEDDFKPAPPSLSVQESQNAVHKARSNKNKESSSNKSLNRRNTPSSHSTNDKATLSPSNSLNSNKSKENDKLKFINASSLVNSVTSFVNHNYMLIGITLTVIVVGVIIFSSFSENRSSQPIKYPINAPAKMPEYWLDATTRKKINQNTLRADSDYSTGEIYYSRGMYNEALKCYSLALSSDDSHIPSYMRSGECYMALGSYESAITVFKKLKKKYPSSPFVNMYMARAYRGMNNKNEAIKYYDKELSNGLNVDVAMEFANYLKSIGEHNKSMEVLYLIQGEFPDKVITLSSIND